MIVIVDNGIGAQDIQRFVRGAKIVSPSSITDANAYILSDGTPSKDKEHANIKLVKANHKPILGVGLGQIYMGMAFGAKVVNSACAKSETVSVTQRSPILLDMKKMFAVNDTQKQMLAGIPEVFGAVAKCPKNEFEVIQHGANPDNPIDALPLFGVHFNPEAGLDGIQILNNFYRFVEMWNKYH